MIGMLRRDHDGVEAIYGNAFFRALAMGMLGIFVPIYIFQIFGGVEEWVRGVRWLALFVLMQRVVIILCSIEVGKMIEKLGFRRSVLLASLLELVVLVLLVGLEQEKWFIYPTALVGAFVVMFYWIARQGLFASDGKVAEFGREISTMTLVEQGAAILGPFSAGVIVTIWGFEVLFLLAMGILVLSVLPLFMMAPHEHKNGISYLGLKNFLRIKKERKYVLGFLGRAADDSLVGYIWPIYMLLVIESYERLGAVVSGVSVIALIMIFVGGKVFDRERSKGGLEDERMFWLGGGVVAVIRLGRGLVRTLSQVLLIDVLTVLVKPFYWIPFDGYTYLAAKEESAVAFFVYREVIYSLGVVLAMGAVVVLIGLPLGWQMVFAIGSIGVLMSMVIARK